MQMSKRPTDHADSKAAKGLATLALLKANYDAGKDHIEMFVPFILDAISIHPSGDFAAEDIKSLVC